MPRKTKDKKQNIIYTDERKNKNLFKGELSSRKKKIDFHN